MLWQWWWVVYEVCIRSTTVRSSQLPFSCLASPALALHVNKIPGTDGQIDRLSGFISGRSSSPSQGTRLGQHFLRPVRRKHKPSAQLAHTLPKETKREIKKANLNPPYPGSTEIPSSLPLCVRLSVSGSVTIVVCWAHSSDTVSQMKMQMHLRHLLHSKNSRILPVFVR